MEQNKQEILFVARLVTLLKWPLEQSQLCAWRSSLWEFSHHLPFPHIVYLSIGSRRGNRFQTLQEKDGEAKKVCHSELITNPTKKLSYIFVDKNCLQ